jgi:thymidylate synthase (FAD)
VLISKPEVELSGMQGFLEGFDDELEFDEYLNDPDDLPPMAALSKVAGQLCYMSFGRRRTWNRDGGRYLDNIKRQKHGSVIEHPGASVVIYGISRSLTHELVRHRAGVAVSQVSQRYVDGRVLRFVMRPEYVGDEELRLEAEEHFDYSAAKYESVARKLIARQGAGIQLLSGEQKRDLRKKVNQAARSFLPNHTEAPVVFTANARSWRHISEMRASVHAEIEIDEMMMRLFVCLYMVDPMMFSDYEILQLSDGRYVVETEFTKV